MGKQSVEQRGQLSEHPLAELIREARAVELSGAFRLAQDRVKSVLYFESGEIAFAISNVRSNRLSERARKWNFVSELQLNAVGPRSSDLELGAALVESGALTSDKLTELLSMQSASVLRPMLLWTEGTWSFDPRVRLAENVRVQLDIRPMLLESARRLPAEFVEKRFSNTNEVLTVTTDASSEFALQPIEAYLLSRIDGSSIRLHELIAISGLPEIQTLSTIYPLAHGGFLERERWPRAFSDQVVSRFKVIDDAVRSRDKEAGVPETPGPEKTEAEVSDSAAGPVSKLDEQQEIENFVARVDSADSFYEILAVTQTADAATIKRAYHSLARRYHPDRFHKEAGTPFHSRLQTIFARVAQAYEMLKDSNLRASYDLRLQTERRMRKPTAFDSAGDTRGAGENSAPNPRATSAPPKSGSGTTDNQPQPEDTFQQGVSALDAGNLTLAVALLAEAARRVPKDARYRAYYGRSLSKMKQMRHKAEAELQAAISLDTNNAAYRVMLAQLYRENGMRRRAQGEAQRALVIDPQNLDAKRLIEELIETG